MMINNSKEYVKAVVTDSTITTKINPYKIINLCITLHYVFKEVTILKIHSDGQR